MISLDQYIENMKEGQKGIYFITGESKKSIMNSPFLEKLSSKDMEVIFMVDPLDEYITQQLKDYGEKKLLCITKENLELGEPDNKDEFESMKKEYEGVCKLFKEVLDGTVEKVVLSNRLDKSPCVLVTNEYGMTANMQRIMKAQALRGNDMGMNMNKTIMELNPYNKTIQTIKAKMSNESDIKTVRDLIHMLYDITILSSGMSLEDPVSFSNRMMKLINIGLGVDNDDDEDVVENIDDIMPSGQTEEESTMEEVD